jgi:hypothetical protein
MGSLHVQCQHFHKQESGEHIGQDAVSNKPYTIPFQKKKYNQIVVHQDATFTDELDVHHHAIARYIIQDAGVLTNADIADTTGAGDAFIGAYLLMQQYTCDTTKENDDSIQLNLNFASWVAGKKLGGPGGRIAVPMGRDVDKELGTDSQAIRQSLEAVLSPFGVEDS